MYRCQQVLISPGSELKAVLEFICSESNKLANCGTYYARQLYFKTGKIPSRAELHRLLKTNPHFKALYSHVAQQTLTSVAESFSSFIGLLKGVTKAQCCGGKLPPANLLGNIDQHPKLPNYQKNSLKLVTFPRVDVKLKNGVLRFPLGSKVRAWFKIDAFHLPMPSNLDYKKLSEIRILPRNGCFYAEFVYKVETVRSDVNPSNVLGIDHGLNNWLTCVSNVGTSFIIDGKHLKSLNQWYNKRRAISF
jgi:transposase